MVDPSIIYRGKSRVEPLKPEIQLAEGVPAVLVPPAPPRARGRKLLPWITLVLIFWVPPAAWVTLAQPQFFQGGHALLTTKQRLATAGRAIRGFFDKHKKAPATFNMLRAFARSEGLNFSSFDGYGQRLDYLRLDERHYLLRSFGADAAQNTLGGTPDNGLVSWGQRPNRPISYKFPVGAPRIGLYPAALVEGCDSPDGVSHAKLFVDTGTLTRHLVVRLKNREDFFMVAPHDRVEEFFWLPTSNRVVYSATGSTRHRDGLYLWDLDHDTVENLTDLARGALPISPAAHGGTLWVSLAGVSPHGPTVYAFAGLRHDGMLDPSVFFDEANLIGFQIGEGPKTTKLLIGDALKGLAFTPPYKKALELGLGLSVKGGTAAQLDWLELSLAGNLEKILLNWHQFSERHAESPLFPYALWLLSSVYGEGFELLSRLQSKDAEVLRTFGTEIARALINLELAPTYLKSLALFTHEQLMDGLALPYSMARLTLPPGPTGPPAPGPQAANPESTKVSPDGK